jgi:hypothetical protein
MVEGLTFRALNSATLSMRLLEKQVPRNVGVNPDNFEIKSEHVCLRRRY